MNKVIWLYASLLFLFSLEMLGLLLAGSHGRIIFTNPETLKFLSIILIFWMTSIISLVLRKGMLSKARTMGMLLLNVIACISICYQMNVFFPINFTPVAIIVIGLYILGFLLGLVIIFRLLIKMGTTKEHLRQT